MGLDIDDMIRINNEEASHEKTKELGIGMKASERVWKGMKKKNISEEGKLEGEGLMEYVPTYAEFNEVIGKMKPTPRGGSLG